MSKETTMQLASDIGWLRLAIQWAKRQPISSMEQYGLSVTHELEAARQRFIARLEEIERFKSSLMERGR